MKDQKINSDEKEFLKAIDEFFNARRVTEHLRFVNHWMELLMGGKLKKKWAEPGKLYDFYQLIVELFKHSNNVIQSPEALKTIAQQSKVSLNFITNEKLNLDYYPYQLKQKEQLNPVNVLLSIFKKKDLNYYLKTLNKWLAEGLNNNYSPENANLIVPIYKRMKKLISACWLINERILSKNSHQNPIYPNALLNYALTAPSLFNKEEVNDPFELVEFFFNFTNLSGYRELLQNFYMVAINAELTHESPSTLYFIYNQYNSLIQAGYLITAQKLNYVPKPDKYAGKTLGKWLFGVRDKQVSNGELELSDEMPHALSLQDRVNPMAYCLNTLTHDNVIRLRFGLKEWFYAGISNQTSINEVDDFCWYEFYLSLQKLTEAFYLIITANATIDQELKTNLNDEVIKN